MVGLTSGEMSGKMAETGRNKVEINGNNILKQIVFSEINKIGNRYYQRNSRKERNFGDWKVENDNGSEKRKLEISKGKEKQHLVIKFEEKQMTGFDFMLSDGKTTVSLQKNKEGGFVISRKDKTGKLISESQDLTSREYLEIRNFPFKFALDRSMDAIDPNRFFRYTTPIVGLAAGLGFYVNNDQIAVKNWYDAFIGSTPISQSVGDLLTRSETRYKPGTKRATLAKDLTPLEKRLHQDSKDLSSSTDKTQESLGVMQEINQVVQFYDPDKPLSQSRDQAIANYLKNLKDSNGLYKYIGPDGKLVGDLDKVLEEIKANPNSEEGYYDLLDALNKFNTGHGIVTPEKILQQANSVDGNIRSAYEDQGYSDSFDAFGNPIPNFNKGLIKGNEAFDYIKAGDFIVTLDNHYGIVSSVTKDESGNITSMNVLNYSTGEVTVINITEDDKPISFYFNN